VPDGSAGYSALYALCLEGGGDIRLFKSDDTTELAREIVSFSVTTETGEIHYKYSGTLSSSVDTDIHVYADGSSSDYAVGATYGRNNVWSANTAVWHFEHSSGNATDSTASGTTLTNTGVTYGTGKIGKDAIISATSGTSNTLLNTSVGAGGLSMAEGVAKSISILFKATGTMPAFSRHIDVRAISKAIVLDYSGGTMSWGFGAGTAATNTFTPTVGTWYHLVLAIDTSNNARYYQNGVLISTGTYTSSASGTFTQFGNANGATTGGFNAPVTIDETRFTNTNLSANWITAEYNNQNSYSTFYSVAAVAGGSAAQAARRGAVMLM